MKPALDASRALTVALTAAQHDALAALDALATRCAKQITRTSEAFSENVRALEVQRDEAIEELREIREAALSLAAEIRDGSADMAQAMARLLGPKVTIGPADEETVTLAQRLAPPMREAAE